MWLDDTQPIDAALTRVRSHEQPSQQTESWFATTLTQTGNKPNFRFGRSGEGVGERARAPSRSFPQAYPAQPPPPHPHAQRVGELLAAVIERRATTTGL